MTFRGAGMVVAHPPFDDTDLSEAPNYKSYLDLPN